MCVAGVTGDLYNSYFYPHFANAVLHSGSSWSTVVESSTVYNIYVHLIKQHGSLTKMCGLSDYRCRFAGFLAAANWQWFKGRQNLQTQTNADSVPWRVYFVSSSCWQTLESMFNFVLFSKKHYEALCSHYFVTLLTGTDKL